MLETRIPVVFAGVGLIVCATWVVPVSNFAAMKNLAFGTAATAKSRNCSDTLRGQTCVPNQRPSMLTEYLACSSQAAVRVLSLSEVTACTEAFMAVKLSFVAGVDQETYRQMPLKEQIEVNLRAYNAFSKWREKNAHLLDTATTIGA